MTTDFRLSTRSPAKYTINADLRTTVLEGATRYEQAFTATAGQNLFPLDHDPGSAKQVDLFINTNPVSSIPASGLVTSFSLVGMPAAPSGKGLQLLTSGAPHAGLAGGSGVIIKYSVPTVFADAGSVSYDANKSIGDVLVPSYTRAQALVAVTLADRIMVDGLSFVADAGGTALTTGDGRKWSPGESDGAVYMEHFGGFATGDTGSLASGDITAAKVLATGATDCSVAGQKAIAWVKAQGGGTIKLLPGKIYYRDDYDGSEWNFDGTKNVTVEGASGAFIFFDDKPVVARANDNHFMQVSDTDGFTLRNLRIVSTRAEYISNVVGGQLVEGKNGIVGTGITNMLFENVSFKNMRWFVTSLNEITNSTFDKVTINGSGRDGLRFIQCSNIKVTNGTFIGCQDDAIVAGGKTDPVDTSKALIPSNVIITGNKISDGWGVRAVQCSRSRISGNIFERIVGHAIEVYESSTIFPAGSATIHGIEITNNKFYDCLGLRAPSDGTIGAIKVKAAARNLVSGDVPGLEIPVYPYNYETDTRTNVNIGGRRIVIAENEIARTLPTAAAYEDFGFGPYQDRAYGSGDAIYHNPAVTDDDFVQYGIYLEGPMTGVEVRENSISGLSNGGNAIRWNESSAPTGIELEAEIVGNRIRNVQEHLIRLNGENSEIRVIVKGNYLDGDPFRLVATHNADNTWVNTANLRGVQWDDGAGFVVVEGNHGMNLSALSYPSLYGGKMINRDNVVYSDFAGTGLNAANKGVGHLDAGDFVVDIEGDPTSAAFMNVQTVPFFRSSSIPTTGKYLQGHFVENSNRAISSGKVLLGWVRLTTGTGHVLGTDWTPVFATTA